MLCYSYYYYFFVTVPIIIIINHLISTKDSSNHSIMSAILDAVLERVWYHNDDPSWKDAHTKRCPKCRGRVVTRQSQWWQKKDPSTTTTTTTAPTTTTNTNKTTIDPTAATSSTNARHRDSYEPLLIRDDEKACIKSAKIVVEDCKCGEKTIMLIR